jgi:hypothetical protein
MVPPRLLFCRKRNPEWSLQDQSTLAGRKYSGCQDIAGTTMRNVLLLMCGA